MAAMTTALTEFTDNGNSVTFITDSHSASLPRLVIQSKREAVGNNPIARDDISVVYATKDGDDAVLSQRSVCGFYVKRNINGADVDLQAAFALLREIVASDEAQAVVDGQKRIA